MENRRRRKVKRSKVWRPHGNDVGGDGRSFGKISLTHFTHTHTHIPTNHTGASGKSEPASFESTLTDIFSSSSTAAQRVCWKVCDGHSHSLLFTFYFFHCEDTIPQGSQSQCVLSTLFPHSPENLFTLPCSESSSVSWAPLSR